MKSRAPLSSRLVYGAIAGFVATAPMTAVMYRMHRRLGGKKRYPLPPREIVETVAPALEGEPAKSTTLAAHFAYGALSGAALAAIDRKPTISSGIAGGMGVWVASYFGWVPAFAILKPPSHHPGHRNKLMILAHVMWGSAFALTQRNLLKSRTAFGDGPLKDAARS